MAGTADEWPILADPNPDDEGWPLQPNNAPGPPRTEPTEPTDLRPADQLFPTYHVFVLMSPYGTKQLTALGSLGGLRDGCAMTMCR
jgi:hypothetical protein